MALPHFGNAPIQSLGNYSDGYIPKFTIAKSEIGYDAWGVPKVTEAYSIFHGMFTFDVPKEMWIVEENGVENLGTSTLAISKNGKLQVNSGTTINDNTLVESRRHPRYQPNRGYLYSSSIFCPNPTANAIRDWGSFTDDDGVFFRLKSDGLYGVVRTTVDTVTSETEYPITIPFEVDFSKGNIYDIQMQWRGVGDIKFFIGNPATGVSELVLHIKHLNTNAELSISNPALPLAFKSTTLDGTNAPLECGCVDLTSEGGTTEVRQYSSATSGEVNLTTAELPIIALRLPRLVDGKHNTRDCALRAVSAYSNADSLVRVYYTRDSTAITATSWSPIFGRTFQESAINGQITAFDKNKMLFLQEKRIPIGGNITLTNPDADNGDFYITEGDYVLVTIQAKNNSAGGVTIEYGQEI